MKQATVLKLGLKILEINAKVKCYKNRTP